MRISDTERREVARRLREMSETESVAAMLDLDDDVRTEMTLRVIRAIVGKGDIFEKLADLIDSPTCKNLATKPADELLCSECGEHVDIAYMESADDYHAKHSPNCGAEVVS